MQAGRRAGTARQTVAGGMGLTYKQATCKTLIK